MPDIERTVGANSRNISRGGSNGDRSWIAVESDGLVQKADHVSQFDPDLGSDDELGFGFTWITMERREPPPARLEVPRRSHLGWSLLIATVANLILGATAIATGATLVGVVACSAMSIATCLLVLAEIACRYGIDPVGRRPPGADDRFLDDRERFG